MAGDAVYVRYWTLDIQFVFGFCKVNSCQRSIENIVFKTL